MAMVSLTFGKAETLIGWAERLWSWVPKDAKNDWANLPILGNPIIQNVATILGGVGIMGLLCAWIYEKITTRRQTIGSRSQKTLGEAIAKPDIREVIAGLTGTAVPTKTPIDSIPIEEIRVSVKRVLQEKATDFRVVLEMDNAQRQALLKHIAETEYLLSKLFANQAVAKEFERQWDKFGLIEHSSISPSSLDECASDCADFLEMRVVKRKDIKIGLNKKQIDETADIARKQLNPEKIELRNKQAMTPHPDKVEIFKKFDEFASRAKKMGGRDDAISLRKDSVPATKEHVSKYKSEELSRMFKYLCEPGFDETKNKNDYLKPKRQEIAEFLYEIAEDYKQ